jgi:Protein of unknown function (DUF2510)
MSPRRHRSYGGAYAVAVIFKIASVLIIIGGTASAIELDRDQNYIGNKGGILLGIIAGTVFTAAAVAFFAYVLDLLIGIERNTFSNGPTRPVEAPRAAPTAPVASPNIPAFQQPGWYADPQGVFRVRYWDGQRWTERTQS